MITQSKNRLNEEGIVSIVVTLIIMIILTLIVTGFAQLARREQREALDRQLSAQASYAAESGINALKAALPYITADSREGCNDTINVGPGNPNPNPFTSTGLSDSSSYTCLLFNRKPKELLFQDVTDDPVITPLTLEDSSGPVALGNLNISWKAKDGSTGVNSSARGEFPTASLWGKSIGILRLDLIPIPEFPVTITPAGLDAATKSFLLQPQNAGVETKRIGEIKSGDVIGVKCNASPNSGCTFTITDLTLKKYYLRMRSIYNTSSVTLNNQVPGGVTSTSRFIGAQIEIDSTGRAADVLKRIKVRIEDPNSSVSSTKGPNFPEYSFSSNENLCKRLSLPSTAPDPCN